MMVADLPVEVVMTAVMLTVVEEGMATTGAIPGEAIMIEATQEVGMEAVIEDLEVTTVDQRLTVTTPEIVEDLEGT